MTIIASKGVLSQTVTVTGMVRIQSNRVCFTLNNYTEPEQDAITNYVESSEDVAYAVVGEEVGECGTPHLQGFFHLTGGRTEARKRGIKYWKTLPGLARAHFEPARGSDKDNRLYCTKEGPYIEKGDPIEKATDVYKGLLDDLQSGKCLGHIVTEYPELSIKHFSNIRSLRSVLPNEVSFTTPSELRQWQTEVLDLLERQNDRQILFVIDIAGGMGKSTLTRWLIKHKKAWACTGGKQADLMHAYSVEATIAVFDMARCTVSDYWPWAFLENIKNGWFTTTKYHSRMITFIPPKVVVFTNSDVPRDKLSSDRYQCYWLSRE